MKAIRQTRIRFEKHELKIVRLSQTTRFFCADCQTEADHLTIALAASALEVSEKTIFHLAESGQIHSTETADRKFLICANSALFLKKINII